MIFRILFALLPLASFAAPVTEHVHEPGAPFSHKDMEALCENTELRVLDLRRAGLTDKHMPFLASLTQLEELRVDSHTLTPDGYAAIGKLSNLKRLGAQSVSNDTEATALFEIISDLPLEELDISKSTQITGKGLDTLNCQKKLKRLDISAGRGSLSQQGVDNLREFTALVDLDLNGQTNFKSLKPLETMRDLERLNLYGCIGIREPGLTSLLEKLPKLTNLNLGFCWPLKGDGLVFPKTLTNLTLVECKQLGDAGFENFHARESLVHLDMYSLDYALRLCCVVKTMH